ncbi:MAG TPA: GNAT family N-acetyltransferase [Ktedonobacteraceae bacterium]|jgi:beta-N-acetylhexosaminidase
MQDGADPIGLYAASTDLAAAYLLWQLTIGDLWPLDFPRFRQILSGPAAHHFVVRARGQLVGLAACTLSQDRRTGHLLALLVAPTWQNKGLGRALHEAVLDYLHAANAQRVQLGGLVPRFWCGLPTNLPAAHAFFSRLGWTFEQPVYDLVQDLRSYTTAPAIYRRIAGQGITLAVGHARDAPEILAFEQREFPDWLPHYQRCAHLGDYQDILCARQQDGRIMGTLLMYTPQSQSSRTDVVWRILLGYDAGALGAVGVSPAAQRQGIGLALVARASELLKARGVRNGYIDWVQLTDFYAQVGYSTWRAFLPSMRELS